MFSQNPEKNVRIVPVLSDNPVDHLSQYQPGDSVGAFSGYLRRAKPSREGLTAQIFGENGHNADMISAMHLTHFQDLPIRVRVLMAKDRHGRIKHKFLCEFIAHIKRPVASDNGQTAQFFGDNGPNADSINILNQSEYLDALVYIQLFKPAEGELVVMNPNTTLPEELKEESKQLVPSEVKELKGKQRAAQQAMDLLKRGGFFLHEAVQQALGTELDYTKWLETQSCCHPGNEPCQQTPVHAWRIPNAEKFRRFHYVPLCNHHQDDWNKDNSGVQAPTAFLNSQQKRASQAWAHFALRQALGVPDGFEPMPATIHTWAIDNGLQDFIPNSFLGFL